MCSEHARSISADGARECSFQPLERASPVFALDAEGVPILISIAALRQLGAVVDFERNLAVFTKICGETVIRPEQAEGGHALLDLSADLLHSKVGQLPSFPRLAALRGFKPE